MPTDTTRASDQADSAIIGISLFLLSVAFGSIGGGLSKLLTLSLPLLLILWVRYVVFLTIVVAVAAPRHSRDLLRPPHPYLQVLRGLLFTGATACFIAAISAMPLANVTAILFVYPFLVTAAAPFVLGEKVAPATWIAVAAGFAGVLIVMRPSVQDFDWHSLFAVGAGACYGAHLLVTRKLTPSTPAIVTGVWTALVGAILLSVAVPFAWTTINGREALLLMLVGLAATASQMLILLACKWTETSRLAPFGYAEIIAAILIGYLVFGDWPDMVAWLGIVVIAASGTYVALAAGRRVPLLSRSRPPAA